MDPQRIPGGRFIGAPKGWDNELDGQCDALCIMDTLCAGSAAMTSFWKPSAQELEILNQGGMVQLWVVGHGHPPVALGVIANDEVADG